MARAYINFLASVSPDSSNLISFDEARIRLLTHWKHLSVSVCLAWFGQRHATEDTAYTRVKLGVVRRQVGGLSHAETRRGFGGDGGGAGRSG